MLSMEPQHFEVHGKKYFAPSVGLAEMDTAAWHSLALRLERCVMASLCSDSGRGDA